MRWMAIGLAASLVAATVVGPVPAASGAEREQAMRNVPRITIDEVKKLMAANQVLLIDVRDPMAFADGHMPGAINVPFDHLPNHVDAWKKEKRLLVTYCA